MKPKQGRAPTMSDVARLAGVNRVTVSVVLNGRQANTRVSEATRQRILEAARELGYHRNARALALRRKKTGIIGYYTGYRLNYHDAFTAETINALQWELTPHRLDLLVFGDFEGRTGDEIYASLANGKIDGLIMIPSPSKPLINTLAGSHLPIVAIADGLPDFVSVVVDDAQGAALAAGYLAAQGHRRVLFRTDMFAHTSAVRRKEAFLEEAAARGLEVRTTRPSDFDASLSTEEEALLTAPPGERPTAVACWADSSAYALLEGCERLGLRVPDDVAIVGFDGITPRIRPARRLTTIRAPWAQVTIRAAQLLLELIDGKQVPQETVFPVDLVLGDTA